MQFVPTPGDVVRVRGRLWTVDSVARYEDCAALDLVPAAGSPPAADTGRVTLLTPFDRPIRIPALTAPRVVSRRRWMSACRDALCRGKDRSSLCAAARGDLVLLPYQLEPAIEAILHGSPRLLLVDAVGLGKTIQAGIILAELFRRHALERALIIAPPGLRDQWADELLRRFGLPSTIADAAWVRAMRAEWPASLNPWSIPGVLVTSIDFAKRPDVRRSLDSVRWDLVIVDEAHAACGDSDRREAAHRSAARARRVLLLTATPHAGDEAAFDSLTRIGALADDEPLALFRRSRADVGLPARRRVRLLRVRGTPAERAVHRALCDYVRAVWTRAGDAERARARLAMIVLVKRSLSGMSPLLCSLEARHDALADSAPVGGHQLALPWDDEEEADRVPIGVLGAPGLDDVAGEREWLTRLITLARAAVPVDSKLRALGRLLRRLREPALVFTEYRDTLASIVASVAPGGEADVLHGGLDRAARAGAIERFTRGSVQRLIATDAAGAGLNLQARCRIVVNLELPWNPMRLEQRIGRVDRIGQTRVVHAINLLAAGTAETAVLARLARRLADADAAVGSVEDVLGWSDETIAERWVGVSDERAVVGARAASCGPETKVPGARPLVCRPDHRAEAEALAADLRLHRSLWAAGRMRTTASTGGDAGRQMHPSVPACAVTGRRLPEPMRSGGVLALVHAGGELLPLFIAHRLPALRRRADVRAAVDVFLRAHGEQILRTAAGAEAACRPHDAPSPTRLEMRDERLAARLPAAAGLQQAGLFDRRVECARAASHHPGRRLKPAPTAASNISRTEPTIALLLLITAKGGDG